MASASGNLGSQLSDYVQHLLETQNYLDLSILILSIVGVIGLALIGIMYAFGIGRSPAPAPGPSAETEGLRGRLEKLEMNLNDFRTASFRADEFTRLEFEFIRTELNNIRMMLQGGGGTPDSSTESGSGGGGSSGGGMGGGGRSIAKHIADADHPPIQEASPIAETQATDVSASAESTSAPDTLKHAPSDGGDSSIFSRLRKTRAGFVERVRSLFITKPVLSAEDLDELEMLLISGDLGVKTTEKLLTTLKDEIEQGAPMGELELNDRLKAQTREILDATPRNEIVPRRREDGPTIVMVVGVNGAGKTTSVAKLANMWRTKGAKVMMVAADTFRAAAVEQLCRWGSQMGVPVIRGAEGAKPSTVVFDALEKAKADEIDVVIIDTAGRLHTKSNLMQELSGVRSIIERHQPAGPHETLLVIDGSTGQNGLTQAIEFNAAVPLTGLIVTKLDGTSKGGIVVAVTHELGIPVQYIGVGESKNDLRPFASEEFVEALFSEPTSDLLNESAHGELRRRREGAQWTL